jgi:hypothetical protein
MDRLRSPSRSRSRSFSAEAERRARRFLRGFGIEDESALRELARRCARLAPGAGPAALEAVAGRWFASLFGWPQIDGEKALAAGRLAWLASDLGRRWPAALLADAPPPALVERLRRALPPLPPADLAHLMPTADLAPARLRVLAARPLRVRTA